MPMAEGKTTTLRCHAEGTAQVTWLREQVDPKLTRWEVLSLILDWACTPDGLRALRDYRANQIRRHHD
jgi:phosphodiesterase/alkaline phosphatase D-like protein